MLTLMKQEYYKAFKQNRLYIWLALSFLFPLAVMGIFKTQRTGEVVANFGQATVYIVFDGIIITALSCLLYTSDAADEEDSVDLGGRRIIKKKKNI